MKKIKVEKEGLKAEAEFSDELRDEMLRLHGIDVEKELTDILEREIEVGEI